MDCQFLPQKISDLLIEFRSLDLSLISRCLCERIASHTEKTDEKYSERLYLMEYCFLHFVVDQPQCASADVVFPARREDIDDARVLDCGCAVFHAAAHNEGVTRSNVDRLSLARNLEMPIHHVHDLLMRVAVRGSNPTFRHVMLSNKQFVVIGKHAAFQPVFRS